MSFPHTYIVLQFKTLSQKLYFIIVQGLVKLMKFVVVDCITLHFFLYIVILNWGWYSGRVGMNWSSSSRKSWFDDSRGSFHGTSCAFFFLFTCMVMVVVARVTTEFNQWWWWRNGDRPFPASNWPRRIIARFRDWYNKFDDALYVAPSLVNKFEKDSSTIEEEKKLSPPTSSGRSLSLLFFRFIFS